MIIIGFVASSCVTIAACSSAASNTSTTTTTTTPSALSCAQNFVSSWTTTALSREVVVMSAQSTSVTQIEQAAKDGFGGILLFGSAVPSNLVATLRSLPQDSPHHITLSVMTDDEGGGVIRMPAITGTWPWAQVMGSTMSPTAIKSLAFSIGTKLHRAGITVDLAPVADVDGAAVQPSPTNPDGWRSFGGNESKVAKDIVAFSAGLLEAQVVATPKHFPGLGGSTGDTDFGPATTKSWSTLQKTALLPFKEAISAGVSTIMMSNAMVPGLTGLPASLSPTAVSALRSLNFKGVIITDSLGAGAISAVGLSQSQAAARALEAGDDEVVAGNPSTPAEGLAAAMGMAKIIAQAVATRHLSITSLREAAALDLASVNPNICSIAIPATSPNS